MKRNKLRSQAMVAQLRASRLEHRVEDAASGETWNNVSGPQLQVVDRFAAATVRGNALKREIDHQVHSEVHRHNTRPESCREEFVPGTLVYCYSQPLYGGYRRPTKGEDETPEVGVVVGPASGNDGRVEVLLAGGRRLLHISYIRPVENNE